jgi:dTDP-4-dehydrorhamnose reductase
MMAVKKKILVTGSNGQLGNELRDIAASFPRYDFIFTTRNDLSISDEGTIRAFFATHTPEFCINCAAYTAVDKAESDIEAAFEINAKAPGLLAAVCNEYNCRFVHISTDYVFDGTGKTPYKEDGIPNPSGVYGSSKLEGERLAFLANPFTIILRTSWVYSSYGNNFVKTMLRLMSERSAISVVNDQFGSPTYAADLAAAIMQIIEHVQVNSSQLHETSGIFHFSNDGVISWFDFAQEIKRISGSDCLIHPITTAEYPTPAKRPAYSVMDKSRIIEVFGIQIKDWKESLEKLLATSR